MRQKQKWQKVGNRYELGERWLVWEIKAHTVRGIPVTKRWRVQYMDVVLRNKRGAVRVFKTAESAMHFAEFEGAYDEAH